MKPLNQMIEQYTCLLQDDKIPIAYREILSFLRKLRGVFASHSDLEVGSVYQGHLDMSYFPITTSFFKQNGLKAAIIYIHKKSVFEVWLSGKNRDVSKRFGSNFANQIHNITVFHNAGNKDAILEHVLESKPDFEAQDLLIEKFVNGTLSFISAIENALATEE